MDYHREVVARRQPAKSYCSSLLGKPATVERRGASSEVLEDFERPEGSETHATVPITFSYVGYFLSV
jgi:hypothetical protein